MKKRNALRRQCYGLPNATTINHESRLFQYYKGDFFTIFVTHLANLQLHQHLKNARLDPGQPVHLLYADESFLKSLSGVTLPRKGNDP